VHPRDSPLPRPRALGLFERLKRTRRDSLVSLFWELVRFGWVGVLTVGLYALEMWTFRRFTAWPAWLDAALAYGPCLVLNYSLHRSFTFRSDKHHRQAGPRYLAIQLSGLAINSGVLWFSVDYMHWAFLPSQIIVTLMLALSSYLGQKLWSF
jgi:putative flippase GtrA